MNKPSIPKGTRDFSPLMMLKRQYIMDVIKTHFKRFGFSPIETPSMENLSTLMGKYGEEGDRLIFKILNSGDYLQDINQKKTDRTHWTAQNMLPYVCEKALRYDLTVPFARYVVMHQNELAMPFKRYQMQTVWRADRPQKGRFREFYQCDADVVGSTSLYQEIELIQLYDAIFNQLGLNVSIQLNNRKILAGLAEIAQIESQLVDFTVALDKLDKIGKDAVIAEMLEKGISMAAITKLQVLFNQVDDFEQNRNTLAQILAPSTIGMKGLEELQFVFSHIKNLGLKKSRLDFKVTLARGLNYYTGCILEINALDIEMGAIGGGGRYDDLTAVFGLKNLSGVGISFGLDRIYLVLEQLNLFPNLSADQTQILFTNLGEIEAVEALKSIQLLREQGINTELYPDNTKLNKQLAYAHKRNIPYVAIIGENELASGCITLKNMQDGTQKIIALTDLKRFCLE